MNTIIDVLSYVTTAPFFWGSMGFITAIAMLIGAMVYDGELSQVGKGLLSIGAYVIMLLMVTVSRVATQNISFDPKRAYASTATIILITFFWILGMVLSLAMFRLRNYRK